MKNFIAALTLVIGMIVLSAGIGLLLAFPIMWCWNYAVVAVWHLPDITWGQAWCLNFMAGCLIKSNLSPSKK